MDLAAADQPTVTDPDPTPKYGTDFTYKHKILWRFVALNIFTHTAALYGLYLTFSAHYLTTLWAFFVYFVSMQGITMGVHRLFAHKAFKATVPVKVTLALLHTVAGQFSVWRWVKDHRVHHKYSDTDADPHNAKRGFFFCHYGWLLTQKHPLVYQKYKEIDDSDMRADKVIMFQKEHHMKLHFLFGAVIPVAVPMLLWNETLTNSVYIAYFLRWIACIHCACCVNSVAHYFGNKPYDKNILPVQTAAVSVITHGEGWHNYHHSFPFDYKAAELGTNINFTTQLIDVLAWLGLVYDLKTVSTEMIKRKTLRTGDGTHRTFTTEYMKEYNSASENLKEEKCP